MLSTMRTVNVSEKSAKRRMKKTSQKNWEAESITGVAIFATRSTLLGSPSAPAVSRLKGVSHGNLAQELRS